MSGTCNMQIKCWPKQLNGRDAVGDQIKNGATVLQWILISRVQTEFVWPRIKKKMDSREQGRDISSSKRGGEVIGTIFLCVTLLSAACPVGPSGNFTALLLKRLVRFSLIYVSFRGCQLRVTSLLDASAKLRKATVSSVMSVRPSVRPHATTRLPLDKFSWNFVFQCFTKICRENSSLIKIWQE